MKSRCCLWVAIIVGLASTYAPVAFGEGVVASLAHGDLEAAIAGGGSVSFAVSGVLTLTNPISIDKDTVLDGQGQAVTLSGGNLVRLFQVSTNVKFELKALTLANGAFIGAEGAKGSPASPGANDGGGAILNVGGNITLSSCTIRNCSAIGGKGGSDTNGVADGGGKGGNGLGGALCNLGGRLYLTNCLLSENSTKGGAGGEGSPDHSDIELADCGHGMGGAIYSSGGSVFLEEVTLLSNRAEGGVPALTTNLSEFIESGIGGDGSGGALYTTNTSLYVGSSSLSSNLAVGATWSFWGGVPPLPFYSAVLGGNARGGAIFLSAGSTVEIWLTSFESNAASAGGTLGFGIAGTANGGAIFSSGSLAIRNTTISNSLALGGGLGYFPGSSQGGGICSSGPLILNGCTLHHNLAQGGDADRFGPQFFYGGVGDGGAILNFGPMAVTNSTVAFNRAVAGNGGGANGSGTFPGQNGYGGGFSVRGSQVTLVNVTIAANRADGGSGQFQPGEGIGGGLFNASGSVTLINSILANSPHGGEVSGVVIDGGHNLCSDTTAHLSAPGSLENTDPLLTDLQFNGGPTLTMLPGPGSPARDAIPTGFPPTDQRGFGRPEGAAGDIGAVEWDTTTSFDLPVILAQPASIIVSPGTSTNFFVVASGPSLSFQWWHNGLIILGATQPSLPILKASPDALGSYWVVVSNYTGFATSTVATLTFAPPLLAAQRVGDTLVLSFSAEAGIYRLLASTNLDLWTAVATNSVLSAGNIDFTQQIVPDSPMYFRVAKP